MFVPRRNSKKPPSKIEYMVNDEGETYEVDVGVGLDLSKRIEIAVPEIIVNFKDLGRRYHITGYTRISPASPSDPGPYSVVFNVSLIFRELPCTFEVFVKEFY